MDSQLTLPAYSSPTCYTFSKDSMINTTLCLNARPVYTISTELQGTTTEIKASDTGELVSRICRREILPETIAFPNLKDGKVMKLKKWLHRRKLDDGSHAYEIETEMGTCLLKKHPIYRLALFKDYDLETPVARWERPNASSPISLLLWPGTEKFHPQIIAAFTIRELKMRLTEKTATQATGFALVIHGQ
ncbi:hypothetical protein B0H19DRAFT_1192983 [Mycena capillaripes]|nr:hypothetical protein B0H19DRAFT_1192983 [Mycena capillaripes]